MHSGSVRIIPVEVQHLSHFHLPFRLCVVNCPIQRPLPLHLLTVSVTCVCIFIPEIQPNSTTSLSYSTQLLTHSRMIKAIIALSLLTFTKGTVIHDGGSCGNHAIPYQVTVDGKGHLDLGCISNVCLEIDEKNRPSRYRDREEPVVKCEPFRETTCNAEEQWIGGIMEVNNGTHHILMMACCSCEGMKDSLLFRTVSLGKGDRYEGGLVEQANHTFSFDLIKEIRRSRDRLQYIVTVHRIRCTKRSSDSSKSSYRALSRSKRRLNDDKKEEENHSHSEWSDRVRDPEYVEGPAFRRRTVPYRRRPMIRRYDDDYYDYDYEVYVPRPFIKRRRGKNNRVWPFARAHADGGIFNPTDVIALENDPELRVVESGSNTFDPSQFQLPPVQVPQLTDPLPPPSGYQPPHEPLPQYVPAYKESPPVYPQPPPARAHQVAFQPAPQAQQQYYYYYPAYNPSLNSIFDLMQCFSGDMEVETPTGYKAIKDLEVGDLVLSMDESMVTFSPVIMFLHKLDDESATFLQIHTEEGEALKLTENHLMYLTDCGSNEALRLVAARDVRIGQCVQISTRGSQFITRQITSISKTVGHGIYAPLTSTGDIIRSSCCFEAVAQFSSGNHST
ncbi:hypothetical protein Q1695_001149 [Nippostrongylus brasiliensis]|nr:hypothetical protein Q1695_001149 [Nippostrongylus brasiliensis]